ncbi:MAG: V-type ATP synthase subunit I [Eubacteriales bacterium]|nr:V-type ATP synthase subunit I [Eubacteriales bacterium]MDD3865991.1 V-type ATP synthase subunit I [Eubacteriales bacterium]MDD4461413.1 V-type ATP synthase subunit I [Eubacteriales bacterium]
MSIVNMDRLTVVGLNNDKNDVMDALMKLGAVEIDTAAAAPVEAGAETTAEAGESVLHDQYKQADQLVSRLEQMIHYLGQFDRSSKPMFAGKRQVSTDQLADIDREEPELIKKIDQLEQNQSRQSQLKTELSRVATRLDVLEPWRSLDLDLATQFTDSVHLFLGSFDTPDQIHEFKAALPDEAPETDLEIIQETESGVLCAVYTWRQRESLVRALLRRFGFDPLPLQGQQGKPEELYQQTSARRSEIAAELESIDTRNQAAVAWLPQFELLHDSCLIRRDKLQAMAGLPMTEQTFCLEGWVPAHLSEQVDQSLRSRFVVAVDRRRADKKEQYPILFRNSRFAKSYEVIVEMYSPPSSNEIDPSPLLAPFFFFFFGMMLSDLGYGLILTLLCLFLIYKAKVGGEMARMSRMLLLSGISSMIWGVVFGGFFGNMLTIISLEKINFPALWFNPMDDPMALMIWSMVFGVLHILAGMAARAYMLIHAGQWQDAVYDIFPWYLIIGGLGMMLGGFAGSLGPVLAIAGAAVLVLFGGRSAKNPIMRLLKGIMSLYNITGYFSDILSYTRILALVLATSVIAMVVNQLGFLLGPTPAGYALFAVVALLGHTLNLLLSALSAYVHTSRLHFVEFFGKFYEGGGRMWRPFRLKTNYVDVVKKT